MTRLLDYLRHIAEAIERINQYTAGMDDTGFLASKITQDAVIRNIEIIGEAGRNITKIAPAFAAANKHLRLDAAYKMRNAVSHGYFAVDLGIVWATLSTDLPKLLADVQILIDIECNK
jgi:uncharacterized protein with HEPN domain